MSEIGADMETITRMIWTTLFEWPLERADVQLTRGDMVTGLVSIDGAWKGAAMLQCPLPLATRLTAAMLDGEATGSDDVRDAIGELANMLAGNVKALLPEPCRLALPMVVFGGDYEVAVVGSRAVATVGFTCEGIPLVVTLLRRIADDEAAS